MSLKSNVLPYLFFSLFFVTNSLTRFFIRKLKKTMKRSYQEMKNEDVDKDESEPQEKKQKETSKVLDCKISDINPYLPEKIRIKVIVLHVGLKLIKSTQKVLFEAIVMDENFDKIKLTAWDQQISKFATWETGQCFVLTNLRIKKTNARYKLFHDCSLLCTFNTVVHEMSQKEAEPLKTTA